MAMFDDVDKKLSGWFNAGAEKAKGMSETLRLSNAIREEETKQAELYRQMGKYFYDYFAVAAEGKMKEWCDGVIFLLKLPYILHPRQELHCVN